MSIHRQRPDGPWFAHWTGPDPENPERNKQHKKSTGTCDQREAERIAAQYKRDSLANKFALLEASRQRRAKGSTIADVLAIYPQIGPTNDKTRRNSIRCLEHVIRRGNCYKPGADVRAVRLSEIDYGTAHGFKASVGRAAEAEGADRTRLTQMQRTANSLLRQARSIFSRRALVHYKHAGLVIPATLQDFLKEPDFARVAKGDYSKPSDVIIARTFADLPALEKTDLDLYLAIWMALGFGLRKSEMREAKVGWFILRDGRAWVQGDTICKNGKIVDLVGINNVKDHIWHHLNGRGNDEYVLSRPGSGEALWRRCGDWMRPRGWKTHKTVHEFRAWAICQVIESTGSVYEAQQWARHASSNTTQRNYGRYARGKVLDIPLNVPSVAPQLVARG